MLGAGASAPGQRPCAPGQRPCAPGPRPCTFSSSAVWVDDELWVAGGDDEDGQCVASVEVLNVVTGVWSEGPRLHQARYRHASVAHEGKLYVIGGHAGLRRLESVEVLDLNGARDAWSVAEFDAAALERGAASAQSSLAAALVRGVRVDPGEVHVARFDG